MIKSDLKCTSLYSRHNDRGTCITRIPHYPGEKIDHCTYFEPLSTEGADVDVLDVIHDRIIYFATEWATNPDKGTQKMYKNMAFGAVLTWQSVAEALSVGPSYAYEAAREYMAMLKV